MARQIKIESGVLNVRTHPHTPERYVELLKAVYRRKNIVKLRGDRHAMISLLDTRNSDAGYVAGLLATFVNVEFDGSWFDTARLDRANSDDLSEISIPENLRPNSATFRFYFDIPTHRLYFQTYTEGKTLTPASALRVFNALFDDLQIRGEFGDVKVTLVQSKTNIARLFSLKVIKEIDIILEKPNADIFADDFEEKIEKHLEESNSREVRIIYRAERGGSIEPTPEIKSISETALENGRVLVRGRDDKGAVTRASDEIPRLLHDKYDPDVTSEDTAFKSLIPRRGQE